MRSGGTMKLSMTTKVAARSLAAALSKLAALPLQLLTKRFDRWEGRAFRAALRIANLPRPNRWRVLEKVTSTQEGFVDDGILVSAARAIKPPGPHGTPKTSQAVSDSLLEGYELFSDIRWRAFLNTEVHGGRRTAWLDGDRVVVEPSEQDVFFFQNYRRHFDLRSKTEGRSLVWVPSPTRTFTEAIYVGFFAPDNWYHWLLETLPRIWLTRRLPKRFEEAPLLIHEATLSVPTMVESLKVLEIDRPVVPISSGEMISVETMGWIDGMFTMRHHARYSDGTINLRSTFHPEMVNFRNHLLEIMRKRRTNNWPRRIFLDRAGKPRRYNRDDVAQLLGEHGFVAVDVGELSFSDQVSLFAGAEAIVGPTGAAWSGILFCESNPKLLYWGPDALAESQVWTAVAELSGLRVNHLTYPQAAEDFHFGEYVLSLDLLRKSLKNLGVLPRA